MPTKIQIRRGTATQWTTANPTLASGEFGLESNTGKVKLGDGTTAWASLAYFGNLESLSNIGDITLTSLAGGEILVYDGTSWINGNLDGLMPYQPGNAGKYLTTDGTNISWAAAASDPTKQIFLLMGA